MDEKQEKQGKQEKKKVNWNIRPYLAIGLISLLVIAFSILFFFLIFRYDGVASSWDKLMNILQPIIIGVIFAYLINPIVKWEEKYLLRLFQKRAKKPEKAKGAARAVSIFGAIVFVLVIIAVLLLMVIPELYQSIERMVVQLPGQVDAFLEWIEHHSITEGKVAKYLEPRLNTFVEYFESWLQTAVLPQAKEMIGSLTSGVISAVKVLFNFIVGIVVSMYVLMSKETFIGQAKKLVYTVLPADKGNVVIEIVRKSNEIFGGFISGKILDSAIIGVLCFIGMSLLKMPYTLLVSAIVGVTNIVPFFGPLIGAIPSAFLIILANPIKGIYFIIFVLILQQLDGNVIGPRILGESTGLSSFWVIFAILVGGGLFGFPGMVFGVPVVATAFYLLHRLSAYILRRKGLPEETADYTELSSVNPYTKEPAYYVKEESEKKNEEEIEQKED